MERSSRIYVAGHRGLVGSAIVRVLKKAGYENLVVRTHAEVDLTDQAAVQKLFRSEKIDYVFMAAAKVGGIHANATQQADFLYDNLMIAANITRACADFGVQKLLFLGSSCIYPKLAPQPMPEDALLTGSLEPTNEGYAIAKIAGLKLCEKYHDQYGKRFVSAMPTNLYGPGDNFHPENSHVIPGMMRRFHEAKKRGDPEVTVWGTGTPRREFLHCDDLAEALLMLMEKYEDRQTINVGTGQECTIRELAETMREVVGFQGALRFDSSKPDGTPRKLLDSRRITALGWKPKHTLKEGLQSAYRWALENRAFD
jgi:GDP-L-fucose synthase